MTRRRLPGDDGSNNESSFNFQKDIDGHTQSLKLKPIESRVEGGIQVNKRVQAALGV
jgi:hypothetical protein